MTTSISLPQHAPEALYTAKVSVDSGQKVSVKTLPLVGMDLSTASPYEDDPYAFSQQLLAQNSHLLPSPQSESSSLAGFHSVLTDTPVDWEEIQGASRQLQRDFKLSDDDYMSMGRRLSRANTGQTTTPPHINALEDLIESIHGDYQQTYAKINEKAAEFMKDANTAIGKLSGYIEAGSDGKIYFTGYSFMNDMIKTLGKYINFGATNPPASYFKDWAEGNSPALPIHTFNGDDKALNFWQRKLGDGFVVQRGADQKIEILPSLGPIKNIIKTVHTSGAYHQSTGSADWNKYAMSSQVFQSLQTAIDSQKNSINSGISQLLEKFRQDNSTFETMIQLLTKMTEDLHRYNAGYLQ
ncbi:TPA: IpaD/SipD/SspD family type III secretion system needle tip protein [Yersinia enterocolitica]